MLAQIWAAFRAIGAIADAIGKLADWFREWQAERRAEEAGAAKERERARAEAEREEAEAADAAREAAKRPLDEDDGFMRPDR